MNFKSIFYLFIAASTVASLHAAAPADTIHRAAARGDVVAVQHFIEATPALVNQPGEKGATPLHVCNGHLDVARLLLDRGAAVNQSNDDGYTPLHLAACNGHLDVARLLLDRGAAVNQPSDGITPLHWAIRRGSEVIVQLLIERGVNVNQPSVGITPLHWAIRMNRGAIVQLLLERGVNVNQQSKNGKTPLHVAAGRGHKAIVDLLLHAWPCRCAQLAVMESMHPRLGAQSPLQGLSKDVVEQIAQYLRPEHF